MNIYENKKENIKRYIFIAIIITTVLVWISVMNYSLKWWNKKQDTTSPIDEINKEISRVDLILLEKKSTYDLKINEMNIAKSERQNTVNYSLELEKKRKEFLSNAYLDFTKDLK